MKVFFACGLAALALSVAGCGGGGASTASVGLIQFEKYDRFFFPTDEEVRALTTTERRELAEREVEHLAGAVSYLSRDRLTRLGKEAIEILIANLDRPDPTDVGIRPTPGPMLPAVDGTASLGRVVYDVLVDIVVNYTDYRGTDLPAFSKKDWQSWWSANGRYLKVYNARDRVPEHVRRQIEESRKQYLTNEQRQKEAEAAGALARQSREREEQARARLKAHHARKRADARAKPRRKEEGRREEPVTVRTGEETLPPEGAAEAWTTEEAPPDEGEEYLPPDEEETE